MAFRCMKEAMVFPTRKVSSVLFIVSNKILARLTTKVIDPSVSERRRNVPELAIRLSRSRQVASIRSRHRFRLCKHDARQDLALHAAGPLLRPLFDWPQQLQGSLDVLYSSKRVRFSPNSGQFMDGDDVQGAGSSFRHSSSIGLARTLRHP